MPLCKFKQAHFVSVFLESKDIVSWSSGNYFPLQQKCTWKKIRLCVVIYIEARLQDVDFCVDKLTNNNFKLYLTFLGFWVIFAVRKC